MSIDSNIALGYRAPQFESPVTQAAQAAQLGHAQQQNMLGQLQMAEMGRAAQQRNQMREILSGANAEANMPQINALLEKAYIQSGDIPGLIAHKKSVAEAEAAQAKIQESKAKTKQAEAGTATSEFELGKKKIEHAWDSVSKASTPDAYKASIDDALAKKLITEQEAANGIQKLNEAIALDAAQGGSQNFTKLRTEALVKLLPAKDQLARTEPKYEWVDLHGKKVRVQTNPNAPGFDPKLNEMLVTSTPHELATEKIERSKVGIEGAKLKLQQEKALQERDPTFQQAMARAKATGEAIAKGDVAAIQTLPKVLDRAERSINLIDELIGKQEVRDKSGKVIQKGTAPHPGFNSAVGATLLPGASYVPGTDAADFKARFDEIKGGAFLEAFESLKGGGAITEKEGEKATSALNRMSLAQSEKEFLSAARDFQDIVRKGVTNAQKRVQQVPGATTGAAPNVDALLEKYK